jgi:hypothetical protein
MIMRHLPRWAIALLAVAALATIVAVWWVSRYAEQHVRLAIVNGLAARFESEVDLEAVRLGWFPHLAVRGTGLVLRHRGRRDIPPLFVIARFNARTWWWSVPARRIDTVAVEGLEITIPPGRSADMPELNGDESERAEDAGDEPSSPLTVTVGRFAAENARLSIMSKTGSRNPRVFDIFGLDMVGLNLDEPSAFTATLTNPVPFGHIRTEGTFGPWAAGDPRRTPVAGTFEFDADLGTIKGIAGTLGSEGRFSGPLERIEASGSTSTPDFRIPKLDAAALPLTSEFDAVIDGSSGDVTLERVDARLGESSIRARGRIAGVEGVKGKRVALDVTSDAARIEDFLRLTVPADPPLMTGALALTTAFDLPPGVAAVLDRLLLDGKVTLERAQFTRDAIQEKVDELSQRGQGRPDDPAIDNAASNLEATFSLENGVLSLPHLTYSVSGARVLLAGTYGLRRARWTSRARSCWTRRCLTHSAASSTTC